MELSNPYDLTDDDTPESYAERVRQLENPTPPAVETAPQGGAPEDPYQLADGESAFDYANRIRDLEAQPPPKSTLSQMGEQLIGSAYDVPMMAGKAVQAFTPEDSGIYEAAGNVAQWAEDKGAEYVPDLRDKNLAQQALITGTRALLPSAATIPAYFVNPLVGGAVTAGLFGGSQFTDTKKKLLEKGVSEEEASKAALMTGTIQGLGESAANALLARPLLGFGKKAIGGGIEGVIKGAGSTEFVKPFAKAYGKALVGEPATEIAQDVGTAVVEEKYGADSQDYGDIAKQSGLAAIGMTTLLGLPGIGGHYVNSKVAERVNKAIDDPTVPTEARVSAVKSIYQRATKEGVQDADAWAQGALQDIEAGLPIRRQMQQEAQTIDTEPVAAAAQETSPAAPTDASAVSPAAPAVDLETGEILSEEQTPPDIQQRTKTYVDALAKKFPDLAKLKMSPNLARALSENGLDPTAETPQSGFAKLRDLVYPKTEEQKDSEEGDALIEQGTPISRAAGNALKSGAAKKARDALTEAALMAAESKKPPVVEPVAETDAEPAATEQPTVPPETQPTATEQPTVQPSAQPTATEQPIVPPEASAETDLSTMSVRNLQLQRNNALNVKNKAVADKYSEELARRAILASLAAAKEERVTPEAPDAKEIPSDQGIPVETGETTEGSEVDSGSDLYQPIEGQEQGGEEAAIGQRDIGQEAPEESAPETLTEVGQVPDETELKNETVQNASVQAYRENYQAELNKARSKKDFEEFINAAHSTFSGGRINEVRKNGVVYVTNETDPTISDAYAYSSESKAFNKLPDSSTPTEETYIAKREQQLKAASQQQRDSVASKIGEELSTQQKQAGDDSKLEETLIPGEESQVVPPISEQNVITDDQSQNATTQYQEKETQPQAEEVTAQEAPIKDLWQRTREEVGRDYLTNTRMPQLQKELSETKRAPLGYKSLAAFRRDVKQEIQDIESDSGQYATQAADRVEHFKAVRDALAEGKPVPENVIAEYPDLQADLQNVEKTQQELADQPIDLAAAKVVNSPRNPLRISDSDRMQGNYPKPEVDLKGFTVAIENDKGSIRKGVDREGREWQQPMSYIYGEIQGVKGADKDFTDVFIKPGLTNGDIENLNTIYVIDQVDPKTGKFDEHKTIVGPADETEAREAYFSNYEDGWKGLGAITPMPVEQFRTWSQTADTTKPIQDKLVPQGRAGVPGQENPVAPPVEPLPPIDLTEARKQPDGHYKVFYRGTRNEVFPGEKFRNPVEAKNFHKVGLAKQESQKNITPQGMAVAKGVQPAAEPAAISPDSSAKPGMVKSGRVAVDRDSKVEAVFKNDMVTLFSYLGGRREKSGVDGFQVKLQDWPRGPNEGPTGFAKLKFAEKILEARWGDEYASGFGGRYADAIVKAIDTVAASVDANKPQFSRGLAGADVLQETPEATVNREVYSSPDEALADAEKALGVGARTLISNGVLNFTNGKDSWPDAIKIRMVGNEEEAYYDRRIFVDLSTVPKHRLLPVLLHALGEHYNLKRMLGIKPYASLMDQIRNLSKNEKAPLTRFWTQVKVEYPELSEGSEGFIAEVIARAGENNPNLPWYRRLLAQIKAFMLKHGLARGIVTKTISDKDLHELLVTSARSAARGFDPRTPALYQGAAEAEPSPQFSVQPLESIKDAVKEKLNDESTWLGQVKAKLDVQKDRLSVTSLALFTAEQVVELAEKYFPTLKNYNTLLQARSAEQSKWMRRASRVVTEHWLKMSKEDIDRTNALVNQSTWHDVDASQAWSGITPFKAGANLNVFKVHTQAKLAPKWQAELVQHANRLGADAALTTKSSAAFRTQAAAQAFLAQLASIETEQAIAQKNQDLGRENIARKQAHGMLRPMFESLPADGKTVYTESNKIHNEMHQERINTIIEDIEEAVDNLEIRRAMINTIKLQAESKNLDWYYAPLSRRGRHWLYGKMPNGERWFSTYDSPEARNKAKAKLIADRVVFDIKEGTSLDNLDKLKDTGADDAFVTDIAALIDNPQSKIPLDAAKELKDGIYQMYLDMLPDVSMRKNSMHRQNTHGYHEDAMQSFSSATHHRASQLANLKFGKRMKRELQDHGEALYVAEHRSQQKELDEIEAMTQLRDNWETWGEPGVLEDLRDGVLQDDEDADVSRLDKAITYRNKIGRIEAIEDAELVLDNLIERKQKLVDMANRIKPENFVKAADTLNELELSLARMMNTSSTAMDRAATALNQINFVMMLGFSLSSGMVNMLQTGMVAMPIAFAKHQPGKVAKAFNSALGDFLYAVKGRKLDEDGNTSISETLGERMDALVAAGKMRSPEALRLTELRNMLMIRKEDGTISRTQTFDIIGVEREGANYGGPMQSLMHKAGWLFHHGERLNREVTLVAAYNLARDSGATKEEAMAYSKMVNDRAHLNYTSENAARLFSGPFARVALQFRKYPQGMLYVWGKTVADALASVKEENFATKAEWEAAKAKRREAARTVAALFTMQASFGGLLGLPLMGALGVVYEMIGSSLSDDDEPWDLERDLRIGLSNFLEPVMAKEYAALVAEAATKGGINALTPFNVASRIDMSNVYFRGPNQELEGRDAASSYLTELFGATGGTVQRLWQGTKFLADGYYMRGAEQLLPKAVSDIVKAARFASEGATTLNGQPLRDMTVAEIVGQVAGFGSSAQERQYSEREYAKGAEQLITDTRSKILHELARAKINGEPISQKDRIAWNRKHPEIPILGSDISSAIRRQRKAQQDRGGKGYLLNPRLEYLAEENAILD